MPINLTIHAESIEEFDTLIARFSGGAPAPSRPAPSPSPSSASTGASNDSMTVAEIKDAASKAGPEELQSMLDAEKAGKNRATAISAIEAAIEAGNAPAGSAAPSAEAASTSDTQAASTASAAEPATEDTSAADITEQDLKDALSALLKAKSATQAMKVLEEASGGCKSLTSGSPNVMEKAKDDPAIMGKVHAALLAAAQA